MGNFEIIMPKMGESIEEATITNWFVKEGDQVVEDDVLLEIATDKVDSEIPSPVAGVVKKILFKQDEVVAVGTVIAVIDTDGESAGEQDAEPSTTEKEEKEEEPAGETGTESTTPEEHPRSRIQKERTSKQQMLSPPGTGSIRHW